MTAVPRRPSSARRRGALAVDIAAVAAGAALAFALLPGADAVLAALWWIASVVVIRSDLERFIIPDTASAAIALLGLVAAGFDRQALLSALAGGVAAFGFFWLTAALYRRLSGRDGLGFGDVKLAGACGLWLGLADQALALEIAALAGLAVALALRWRDTAERREARAIAVSRTAMVPFGAFLAPAAWLVHVVGPALRDVAERLG